MNNADTRSHDDRRVSATLDIWRLVWIFIAVIPFVLFLRRGPRTGESPAEAERAAAIVEG